LTTTSVVPSSGPQGVKNGIAVKALTTDNDNRFGISISEAQRSNAEDDNGNSPYLKA